MIFFWLFRAAKMLQVQVEQKYVGSILGVSGGSLDADSASSDGFPPLLRSHYQENCQRESSEASWIQERLVS